MRHYKKGRKLGTDASHTKAIKKNLVVNLLLNDRVKTTLERAKEVRGDVDRVITWAKRGDVHARRLAIAKLGDKNLVAELFSKVAQGMFKDRPGGYTRILRLGTRRGDGASIVIMELVQEPLVKKEDASKGAATGNKAAKPAKNKVEKVEPDEPEAASADTDEAAEPEGAPEPAEVAEPEPEGAPEPAEVAEPEPEGEPEPAEVAEPEPAEVAEPEPAEIAEAEPEPAVAKVESEPEASS